MLVALRTRRWRGSVSAHRGAVAFLFASALLNVSNLAFHLVVSRIIGPGRYGALSALVVVTGLLAIPLGALQTASTHAQAGAPAGSDARRLVRAGFLLGAAVLVVGVACAPSLAGILHLRSPVSALLLAAWLGLSVAAAVPTGLLFGQGRFAAAGVSLLAGGGVVRLIAGAVLSGPMGVAGGMLATAIGAGVTLVIVLCAIRGQLVAPSDPPLRMSRTIGALSLAALVGLALLTGLDTILARNLMSSVQSGVYASAAVAGRIALFAPGAIALVAFPHFAEAYKRDADDARLLGWSLGLIVVIGAGATAVLSAAPGLVISLMFGSRYADAASLVALLAVEGAALGVLSLLIYYLI
ncbi:MAG: oligosaccharide flippase family protein, partial [Solirubrobacteraceae bacterium]